MSDFSSLKLLLTTRALTDGGAEKTWVTLAREFAARGHRVILAVDDASGRIDFGSATPPTVVELGCNHVVSTLRLTNLLRRERPDVALAAISGNCVKLLVAATALRSPTRIVLSYHGFEEWRTGRLAASGFLALPLVPRFADRIVAVSDGLRRRLVERWGADPDRVVRIYNAIPFDLAAAAASAADLAERPPIVTAIGRLSAEKGFDDLLDAFSRVRRPEARLVIGGDGPERERLEQRITALGLGGRVTLLGRVDPLEHYRKARVIAVPSRTEAFGLVVAEALAHGLPVVATDCDGPHEILGGGRWGRLVPIGDPEAMALALEAALDDPGDPAARIARAADFSLETGMAAWSRLIEDLVEAPPRR